MENSAFNPIGKRGPDVAVLQGNQVQSWPEVGGVVRRTRCLGARADGGFRLVTIALIHDYRPLDRGSTVVRGVFVAGIAGIPIRIESVAGPITIPVSEAGVKTFVSIPARPRRKPAPGIPSPVIATVIPEAGAAEPRAAVSALSETAAATAPTAKTAASTATATARIPAAVATPTPAPTALGKGADRQQSPEKQDETEPHSVLLL